MANIAKNSLGLVLPVVGLTLTAASALVAAGSTQDVPDAARRETSPASVHETSPHRDLNGYPLPQGAVSRIGANLYRHYGGVSRMLYTPDAKSLACTSWDGYLHLWDTATNKLRWRLQLDKRRSQPELVVSGDGKKVAVLSDLECVVAALGTGERLARCEWRGVADDKVRCLAIAPDMAVVARGCFDATVRLCESNTGRETARIVVGEKAKEQFPLAVAFSADGKTLYVLANERPSILVFDAKSGKAAPTLPMAKTLGYLCRLVLSPKGDLLAAIGPTRLALWDLRAGTLVHLIEKELSNWRCGDFSLNGSLVAVGGMGTDVVVFDTATGKEQQRLRSSADTISLAFTPDGTELAAADTSGGITQWHLDKRRPMSRLPELTGLKHLRFADDGKQLVCLGDQLSWWDAASAKPMRLLTRDPEWYYAPSISLDGKLVVAPLFKGDLVLIDAATGQRLRTLTGHRSASDLAVFSPDRTRLCSAAAHDPRILIWDVTTGKLLHELQSKTNFMSALAVSPDGRWLASAGSSQDHDIRLWDFQTGKLVRRLLPRHSTAFSLIFSADSSRLVSVGPGKASNAGELQLWDVATGTEVRAFTGYHGSILCVALTADGRMLATGGEDKTLRLWEVASGQERRRLVGHQERVFSVDFAPSGRVLAAASADAPIYFWDVYAVQKPKYSRAELAAQDRAKIWQALGDIDASDGFQCVAELIARPREAVTILEEGWHTSRRVTPKQMRQWVEDLDSGQFVVRKTATEELQRFGGDHEDLLREGLKQAGSLESRMRLEQVLRRLDPQRGLRRSRMLEILEQLGTMPARSLLEALADQKNDALMSREATSSLKRHKQRDQDQGLQRSH